MSEWQPIETAPKDRIRIIGAQVGYTIGEIFFGAAWSYLHFMHDSDYVQERKHPCWRFIASGERVPPHLQPTHWMPMPEPPKGNE